jgi:hypothetical protein
VDRKGKIIDTEYRLMSHEEASHAKRDREDGATRKKVASATHAMRDREDSAARKKEASAARSGSARAPNSDNAWSRQPWGAQQQWGWQSGSGQQWRDDRREWRSSW